MGSYLKELDELIEDRSLSDSQVIFQARLFIDELENCYKRQNYKAA